MRTFLVVILFVGGIYSYVNSRLFGSLELGLSARIVASLFLAIPFVLLALQPLYFWTREHRQDSGFFFVFQKLIHFIISYLNYLVFTVIFRDLATLILSFFDISVFNYDRSETLIVLLLPVFLFSLGHLTVLLGPHVLYRKLSSKKLSKAWQGFRIVQISDLHLGASQTKYFIRRTVERTNALNPDVVVFTGDLFDGTEKGMRAQFEILKRLKAKQGLLFCSGNHEYYWSYPKLAELLGEIKMLWLNNSKTEIKKEGVPEKISFFGVPDPQARAFGHATADWEKLASLYDHEDREYRILLCHQPFLFDVAATRGFDLQLSGHTHGGQFFPWNFLIRFFQKYPKGFYQKGNSLLYVNQGTAYWGPPDRLGTRCEITCFDVVTD